MNLEKMNEYDLATYFLKRINLVDELNNNESIGYNSIVLAVIDSVYSINSKYTTTLKAVKRFSNYVLISNISESDYSVEQYFKHTNKYSVDEMADKIYRNKQRTSTRNGILKADAINQWLILFKKYNINTIEDVDKLKSNYKLIQEIRSIKGQSSGLTLDYFFMLTGSNDFIKADRHIINFLSDATGENVSQIEALKLMEILQKQLNNLNINPYRDVPLRKLDHCIWKYMSSNKSRIENNLSYIFDDKPKQWGLRGAPYLWDIFMYEFQNISDTITKNEFETHFRDVFHNHIGVELGSEEKTKVEKIENIGGGMSNGYVSHKFFLEQLERLLKEL